MSGAVSPLRPIVQAMATLEIFGVNGQRHDLTVGGLQGPMQSPRERWLGVGPRPFLAYRRRSTFVDTDAAVPA